MEKRTKKTWLIIVILAILIALIIQGYFLFFNKTEKGFTDTIKEIVENIIPSDNDNKLASSAEDDLSSSVDKTKSSSQDASGGGGSETGIAATPNENSSCKYQQIPYTIGNLQESETCTNYQDENCTEKIFQCLVDVINLDESLAGTFTVEILFFEKGKTQEQAFDSSSSSKEINPKQTKTFTASTTINDPILIKKEITCFYQTLEVPEREIC